MMRYLWAAALCAVAAAPSLASPVTTYPANVTPGWYVGNGQVNGNFVVTRDDAFTGGALELGLRAQERFVGSYTPTSAGGLANGLYNVQTGQTPNPTPTSADYAAWGFDFSVSYAGGISNLQNVTLSFEQLTPGLTPLANQSVPGSVFPIYGDSNPAAHTNNLVQNTFNPGFDFLSGPGSSYNFNQPGIYRISLTATAADGSSLSNSILIDIGGVPLSAVPEPATMAVFGCLGLVAFGARLRRKTVA